ncbi:hypothetical protein QCA50_012834 [Cerrena zonata]|uniref:Uncharacterized protein n=1 Tax=Cerrena zonata TaxID=2478898 RepID=A0AAW0FRB9_9APHY
MFALSSRIGLASAKPSMLMKPALIRGLKTIPQPPGFIVGTVNDAYVHPAADKFHGSRHWASERIVAVGVIISFNLAPLDDRVGVSGIVSVDTDAGDINVEAWVVLGNNSIEVDDASITLLLVFKLDELLLLELLKDTLGVE